MSTKRWPLIAIPICLFIGQRPTAQASPTVFTVTNANDSAERGSGSLRRAVLDANENSGPDVIRFAPRLNGSTLMLALGRLNITDDLTINGLGAENLTIHGGGGDIFRIARSRIAVAVSRLTLEGGGEGIEIVGNRNSLTITDVTVIGSGVIRVRMPPGPDVFEPVSSLVQADDGVRIQGDFNRLSIVNSSLIGNEDNLQIGMAAEQVGHNNIVDVVYSTMSHATGDGVAISGDDNSVTIQNSTMNQNGLFQTDINDGLDINGARNSVRMEQVTVSGNGEHGVDIEGPANRVTVEHSTITSNLIGLVTQDTTFTSTVFVKNTIIAGNVFDLDTSAPNELISGGYNLVGVRQRGDFTDGGHFHGPGDITGTDAQPIDPRLGPLQNNGGRTLTHRPSFFPTSPAINKGDPNFVPPPDFDQRGRGFQRILNGRVDIGAVEQRIVEVIPEFP